MFKMRVVVIVYCIIIINVVYTYTKRGLTMWKPASCLSCPPASVSGKHAANRSGTRNNITVESLY